METLAKEQEELAFEPGACHFPAPKGWTMIDPKVLLAEVKVMVRGVAKQPSNLPPSLNLALEETDLSQEEYLDEIKTMNSQDRNKRWSRIGSLETKAGEMALTQLDMTTSWGDVRMLQAVMIKNHIAYVITATAHLSEFAQFSNEFLCAMQAFDINKDLNEMVGKNKASDLKDMTDRAKKEWRSFYEKTKEQHPELSQKELSNLTFKNDEFQTKVWKPLVSKIQSDYKVLGSKWQEKFIKKLQDELFS